MEKNLKISDTIRRCQRNWDVTKKIPNEHIQKLSHIAKYAPSKQDEGYFDLMIIKSRDIINQVHERSVGFSVHDENGNPLPEWKNPQTSANVLFMWFKKTPSTVRNFYQTKSNPNEVNGSPKRNDDPNRRDNALISIGISMGLTAWNAAELGYVTGFSKNIDSEYDLQTVLNYDKNLEPMYALGIGFPDQNLPHNVSHEGNEYHSFSQYEKDIKIYEF